MQCRLTDKNKGNGDTYNNTVTANPFRYRVQLCILPNNISRFFLIILTCNGYITVTQTFFRYEESFIRKSC